jgi:hypothetical protein
VFTSEDGKYRLTCDVSAATVRTFERAKAPGYAAKLREKKGNCFNFSSVEVADAATFQALRAIAAPQQLARLQPVGPNTPNHIHLVPSSLPVELYSVYEVVVWKLAS